nr:heme biosynthesis protein HemY [uncultured Dethiosulfovibrio sp.]
MRNIKLELKVTDRAKERIVEIGPEVTVFQGSVGLGCGAVEAVLVKSGAPESVDNYQLLTNGQVSVWVPDFLEFDGNTVDIDLKGIRGMVNLVVTSAFVEENSGCGGCSGCSCCN